MKTKPDPSPEILHSQLRYDDEIGALYWLKTKRANQLRMAGGINSEGYWTVKVFGKTYKAHRLIWIYHHGAIPEGLQIDHINGNRSDNHIENLRLTTPLGNSQSQRLRITNTSGIRGVHQSISHGRLRWRYERRFAGRQIMKQFPTKAEAIAFALKTEHALQQFQTRLILPPIEEDKRGIR